MKLRNKCFKNFSNGTWNNIFEDKNTRHWKHVQKNSYLFKKLIEAFEKVKNLIEAFEKIKKLIEV